MRAGRPVRPPPHPRHRPAAIITPDAAPAWTLDQIAGLVFGAGMLASVFAARGVDAAVARAQRRELGLCEQCGGVNDAGSCSEKGCPLKKGGGGD